MFFFSERAPARLKQHTKEQSNMAQRFSSFCPADHVSSQAPNATGSGGGAQVDVHILAGARAHMGNMGGGTEGGLHAQTSGQLTRSNRSRNIERERERDMWSTLLVKARLSTNMEQFSHYGPSSVPLPCSNSPQEFKESKDRQLRHIESSFGNWDCSGIPYQHGHSL